MHFSSILAVWITIQLTIKIGQPTTKVEEPLKVFSDYNVISLYCKKDSAF